MAYKQSKEVYCKPDNPVYSLTKILSMVGALGGAGLSLVGRYVNKPALEVTGVLISCSSTTYLIGAGVAESQFKKAKSELEEIVSKK